MIFLEVSIVRKWKISKTSKKSQFLDRILSYANIFQNFSSKFHQRYLMESKCLFRLEKSRG